VAIIKLGRDQDLDSEKNRSGSRAGNRFFILIISHFRALIEDHIFWGVSTERLYKHFFVYFLAGYSVWPFPCFCHMVF
jgi:hypothetical protein